MTQTCPYSGVASVMSLYNTRTGGGISIPAGSALIGQTLSHFTLNLFNEDQISGTVTCGYKSGDFDGTWDTSCPDFDADTIGTGAGGGYTPKQMEFSSPVTISEGDCFGIYFASPGSSATGLAFRAGPSDSPDDGRLFEYLGTTFTVETRQPGWCYTTSATPPPSSGQTLLPPPIAMVNL